MYKSLLTYLQERGINIALAKKECSEAHFTHHGKRYFAIAFPNVSGGYEIRNRYFKGCIAPKEISHIRQSRTVRETCYVFEGFMDYLSFLTLRLENCPKYPCTVIVKETMDALVAPQRIESFGNIGYGVQHHVILPVQFGIFRAILQSQSKE